MLENIYTVRVMYPDTDKMGTVHHSVYAKYCESARWELFRKIGISYKSIEDAGYMIPVVSMNFRFVKTVQYDELLTIKTTLIGMKGARLWFSYIIYNSKGELVNEASTEMAFVSSCNFMPCVPPDFVKQAVELHSTVEAEAI